MDKKTLYGAVIGDIAGSRFEFHNHRSKDFEIFAENCFFTDDTVMTLAVAEALVRCKGDYSALPDVCARTMREIGRHYPRCGYGGRFGKWIMSDDMPAYHSFGNGAAMRVSPVAYAAQSREQVIELARAVTCVTHDHPEGIRGAEVTALLIFDALHGAGKSELRATAEKYYPLDFTIDEIRPFYRFNVTCQGTVPQALEAFFEAESFEDTLRTAISVGGDSDTLAAIACSVAEAFYGVPEEMARAAESYLDERLKGVRDGFCSTFCAKDES